MTGEDELLAQRRHVAAGQVARTAAEAPMGLVNLIQRDEPALYRALEKLCTTWGLAIRAPRGGNLTDLDRASLALAGQLQQEPAAPTRLSPQLTGHIWHAVQSAGTTLNTSIERGIGDAVTVTVESTSLRDLVEAFVAGYEEVRSDDEPPTLQYAPGQSISLRTVRREEDDELTEPGALRYWSVAYDGTLLETDDEGLLLHLKEWDDEEEPVEGLTDEGVLGRVRSWAAGASEVLDAAIVDGEHEPFLKGYRAAIVALQRHVGES